MSLTLAPGASEASQTPVGATEVCSCTSDPRAVCPTPLRHQGCPCCMPYGPRPALVGPIPTPVQESSGSDLRGTPRIGNVEDMTNTACTARPATAKQFDLIRSLLTQIEAIDAEVARQSRNLLNASRETGRFDAKFASEAIDGLLSYVKANRPVATPITAKPARTNRYAGRCANCGQTVEAEAGTLENIDSKWVVYHIEGECPITALVATDGTEVPSGHYALDLDGDDNVKFYNLTDRGVFAQASEEYHLLTSARSAQAVIDAIALDIEGASRLYGHKLERCGVCNRKLTDASSRAAGIGPRCRENMGW